MSRYSSDETDQEFSGFNSEPDLGKPLFKENVFDALLDDKNLNSTESDAHQFEPKTDIFAVKEAAKTPAQTVDFSKEKQNIQAEYDLVTAIVAPLKVSQETKQELIDFAVNYYDITPENALKHIKEASFELREQMRILLEEKGVWVNYDGSVSTEHSLNQALLKDPEIQATLSAYQELITLDNFVDNKIQKEINEHEGEVLFEAITKYNIDSQAEEQIVGTALERIKHPDTEINQQNADALLLKTADYLKTQILVHLLHQGFSTNAEGNLTLPGNKEDILKNPELRSQIRTLEGAYKITDPNKFPKGKHLEVVFTEDIPENTLENTKTPAESLRQNLEQLGFNDTMIAIGTQPEIVALMGQSTINTKGTYERGLLGFNQVVGQALEAITQKAGFTLDGNLQPVLAENWLQKNFLFWTKADRINKIKNSPEYKKAVELASLQKEVLEKHQATLKKRQTSPKGSITDSNLIASTTPISSNYSATKSLRNTALAGAAAGILTGTALYKNQDTDVIEEFDVSEIATQPTKEARPLARDSATEARQNARTLVETPTIEAPAITAQSIETENKRKRALEVETLPEVAAVQPKPHIDARFVNTKFKKPASTNKRRSVNPDFKIDPFKYQSTNPDEAPKLERPQDMYPIEEAPDLDNPLPTNKRIARKGEPVFEPGVIYQDNRLPRTKQSPEVPVTMPDLSSLRKKVKEPSVAEKTRLAREKVVQALQDNRTNYNSEESGDEADNEEAPETIDESNLKQFEKIYNLSTDIRTKAHQISNFDQAREQAEKNALNSDVTFDPNKWEKGTQAARDQFEKDWAEFSTKKLEALRSGQDYLASLEKKLSENQNPKVVKALKQEIGGIAEKLSFFKRMMYEPKSSLLESPEESLTKQLQKRADRKLEAYPPLKTLKKKPGKNNQTPPLRNAA